MAKIVVVTSGKGGAGKTTTSAAFAAGLALAGHKTAVIDFDVGLRNLDLIMGCERRVVYDFINVIQGEANLNQALIKDKQLENLFILAASQTRDKEALTIEGVEKVLKDLAEMGFEYIVCDSPAASKAGRSPRCTLPTRRCSSPIPRFPRCATPTASWACFQARPSAPSKAPSRSRNTCSSPATTPIAWKTARC